MTCFVVGCLALVAPRLAIAAVVVFSDYIGRAYDTFIWPFIGFLVMPLTTLAYAWAINTRGEVDGLQLVVVAIAAMMDLGLFGGGAKASRSRRD